jgi:hypothetical protein
LGTDWGQIARRFTSAISAAISAKARNSEARELVKSYRRCLVLVDMRSRRRAELQATEDIDDQLRPDWWPILDHRMWPEQDLPINKNG